jgi:hypothetical protein
VKGVPVAVGSKVLVGGVASGVALASGVMLTSSVGVPVGDDVGLISGPVGVEVAVTGTAFPISMTTPTTSAADSASSRLTSDCGQLVPSNIAMIAASMSPASTMPLQSASPGSCAPTDAGARRTWIAAYTTTIKRHILNEGSRTLPQLNIPTPSASPPHQTCLAADRFATPKKRNTARTHSHHGVGVGVATRMTICFVGPVRPKTSASLAVTTFSPGAKVAVAATMSQNCCVAAVLTVLGSRVMSTIVHADCVEKA